VMETNWRNYDLQQPRSSIPVGPLVIMIHMASVWVPFTSESKEAIADYDEIRKEMKLALMECGRKLGTYLRKRQKMRREGQRRDVFERYIGEIAKAVNSINGTDPAVLYEKLLEQARKRTAVADQVLDDEGRTIRARREADTDEDGVIIVESARSDAGQSDEPGELQQRAAKVAAQLARGDDDDDERLPGLDGDAGRPRAPMPPRGAASGKPAKGKTRAAKPAKAASPAPAAAPKSQAAENKRGRTGPAAGPVSPKPKMRLLNGKLVPADGPSLF
jgi:hypothetical protein